MATEPVLKILAEAKKLAQQYRALTGKPLSGTGFRLLRIVSH